MGDLADRLSRATVVATIAGVDIEATLRDRRLTLEFGESVYEFLTDAGLTDFLERLGRKLLVGWARESLAARRAYGVSLEEDDTDRAFLAERADVEASGASDDDRVTVHSQDLRDLSVVIAPGTVRAVPVDRFCADAQQAGERMIADYAAQVHQIKLKHYG